MGEREYFMNVRAQTARHQSRIADLMAHTLTLLKYQTEREHPAHELQTKLVIALGQAYDAAVSLANALDPDKPALTPST